MEEEFIRNQERLKPQEEKIEEERSKVSQKSDYVHISLLNCPFFFVLILNVILVV